MPISRISNPSKTVGTSRVPASPGSVPMPPLARRPVQPRPPATNYKPPGGFGGGMPNMGGQLPPYNPNGVEPGPGFARPTPPSFDGMRPNRPTGSIIPPGLKPSNPIAWYPPANNGGSNSAGPQAPGGSPVGGTYFPGGERPGTFYVPPGFTLGPNNRPGGGIGNGFPGRGNEGRLPPGTNPISGPQVPPKNPWIPPRSRPGRWAEGMDLGPPSNSPGKGNNGAGNKPVIDGGPYAGMTRGEAMRLAAKSTAKAMGRNPGSFPGMMPFIQAMRRPKAGNPPPTNDRPIVNPPTTQDPMPVYNPNTGAFGPPTQNMNSLYGPMDTSGYSNWLGSLQGTPSYNNMNDIQRYLDPRYRGGV